MSEQPRKNPPKVVVDAALDQNWAALVEMVRSNAPSSHAFLVMLEKAATAKDNDMIRKLVDFDPAADIVKRLIVVAISEAFKRSDDRDAELQPEQIGG